MADTLPDIRLNEAERRFELEVDGGVAVAAFIRTTNKRIVFTHTEVPEQLEGQGIASHLVQQALDYARAEGLEVVPLCPFVTAFLRRHPAYQDLVMPGYRV